MELIKTTKDAPASWRIAYHIVTETPDGLTWQLAHEFDKDYCVVRSGPARIEGDKLMLDKWAVQRIEKSDDYEAALNALPDWTRTDECEADGLALRRTWINNVARYPRTDDDLPF